VLQELGGLALGGLALGGGLRRDAGTELGGLALGRDAQLRRLALCRRAQRAELALERRAALALLGGDRALDACRLALRGADELLGAALGAEQRALDLRRARGADLLGLEPRAVEELGDLVLGAGTHL